MLFHNQTFKERLDFFKLNLCDFPAELSNATINHTNSDQVISGLKNLQKLFFSIYTEKDIFQVDDPLESLHNVTNTIMFLYSAGFIGQLCKTEEKWYLKVDKKQLKSHYKQPVNKPMKILEHFSFRYECYKSGTPVETLIKSTHFNMYCDNWNNIPLAISYIMKNTNLTLTNDDYARMQGLFYKLDYGSMFLKENTKKDAINPFRVDIQKTAYTKSELLVNLLEKILSKYQLKTKIKIHEYFTPHWVIQFYTFKTNKFVFNLNVAADTIFLEIRLSIKTLENLATKKMKILGHLNTELDKFGCISCNNQCNKENLKETNGIHYCTEYSEARLLLLNITSNEDVASALMVLDYENNNSDW